MKKPIYLFAISLLSLAGCAQQNTTAQDSTTQISASPTQNPTTIKKVSKVEFKSYLESHENAQLIDVRTPSEFASGNINGAINIDFNSSNFEQTIQTLDKNAPVLIYCRSGARSAKALKIFEANGFTHVLELEGGFLNW